MSLILEAVKKALVEGKATVNLKEAAGLQGSGSDVGGRTLFDDAFFALRMNNPLRQLARVVDAKDSNMEFVAKTGNATNPTNPWGYEFTPNVGSPSINTSIWQLPIQALVAQLPIRTAALSDINNIEPAILGDLALEFAQIESESMMFNNDQSSTATVVTGEQKGLRGLNSYPSGVNAAFGTSGTALTCGLHTVKTVQQAGTSIAYNDMVSVASALPPQYYGNAAWMIHPTVILQLRELKDSGGLPLFLDIGDKDGYSIGNIFGHPVIPNPYMDVTGAGKFPIYLAAWDQFLTIGDNELMTISTYEQTQPGFVTIFAEKRVVSSIRDVFAGVRLTYTAP